VILAVETDFEFKTLHISPVSIDSNNQKLISFTAQFPNSRKTTSSIVQSNLKSILICDLMFHTHLIQMKNGSNKPDMQSKFCSWRYFISKQFELLETMLIEEMEST
jgi:hypothetical protein